MELQIVIGLSILIITFQTWILNREINKKNQILKALLEHKMKDISNRVDIATEINEMLIKDLISDDKLRIKFSNLLEIKECGIFLDVPTAELQNFKLLGSFYYSAQEQKYKYGAVALTDVPVAKRIPYSFIEPFISCTNK